MSQCRINARTIPRIALMRKWAALIVPSRVVLTAVVSRHVRMIRVKRLRTGVDAIWWTQTNNTGTQKIPRSWTQTKPGKVPHAWVAPRRLERSLHDSIHAEKNARMERTTPGKGNWYVREH